jgi:hypothetical protein
MTDQERFDQEVATKGKLVLEVLGGLGIFAAVVMSMVALIQSGQGAGTATASALKPGMMAAAMPAATSAPAASAPAPKPVDLTIAAEAKKGPDGKLHDAFSVTNFSVKVGQPLTLHVNNTDSAPHSITSQEAGVNIIVQPGTHDYTLVAQKAGKFEWNCALPCDDWAMVHPGYMAGYITAS